MHEYVDEILNARFNRSLEIVEIGMVEFDRTVGQYYLYSVNEWIPLGNVEEYSISDEQSTPIQTCTITLAGSETINVADYYVTNALIRIRSRLSSDLHPGESRTIGTFFIDSIETGSEKNIVIKGRSTLKMATLRPYIGRHKRAKAFLDPDEFYSLSGNFYELMQVDPGPSYPYYIFVLPNPYVDPSEPYYSAYGDLDYIKNWCESPSFPIYIDTSGSTPSEADRVYPGENFEIIYALGQIRCSKDWWNTVHPGDSFYVGVGLTTFDPLVNGAGSLNWYKGEMQAYQNDYNEEIYGIPLSPPGWGWHDNVFAGTVIRNILEDCGFQAVDNGNLFYISNLYPYILTNCEKIFYYDSIHDVWVDYTDSNAIPMPSIAGDYLYIGATERFRQIYVEIATEYLPPQNYKIQWQFYNKDDGWLDLDEVENETVSYQQNGRIRFTYRSMAVHHFTTANGYRAFWIRGYIHPDCSRSFTGTVFPGYFYHINLAWDVDIPDLVLRERDRVTHIEAIENYVLPYIPPNYKLHNEPNGAIKSYLVKEKIKPDYQLSTIENVTVEKNDSGIYTAVRYYGRGRFLPNRLSIKDREPGDVFTLEPSHEARISSGNWEDAFNDDLRTTDGVEFTFPDMSYVKTLHCTFHFNNPVHLDENARFGIIGKGGLARWSIMASDYVEGGIVFLTDDSHDFPVDVDEFKVFEAPFNLEYTNEIYVWLWGYNPVSRRVGYREIGLWDTDILVGEAILGTTPPFNTDEDKLLMQQLGLRVWQNEEIDERANTQAVVDYRALQHLSYFLRNIQTIQVDGIRPDVRLHDTVYVNIPELSINDTFLVEGITRSPNSIISAILTSYRTDIQSLR